MVALLALVLAVTPSIVSAQVPGDCNNDGFVNAGDLTYLISYLYTGGPPPPVPADCDCDNHPGITDSDAFYLEKFLFIGGVLFPSPGINLRQPAKTMVYTLFVVDGIPPRHKSEIWIAVNPNETIQGFALPFSFANSAGEAVLICDSVSFVGSILTTPPSASIDNVSKTFIITYDPNFAPAVAAGAEGMMATAYFSQVTPGSPHGVINSSMNNLHVSELYPPAWGGVAGAIVWTPSFIDKRPGEVTCDHFVDIDDVVQLLGYIFGGGSLCYW
jgi:hypothetical protein